MKCIDCLDDPSILSSFVIIVHVVHQFRVLLRAMALFTDAALEGRALEHELAADRRVGVRMIDPNLGGFGWVRHSRALAARSAMKRRCQELRADLLAQGIVVAGADKAAVLVRRVSVVQSISTDTGGDGDEPGGGGGPRTFSDWYSVGSSSRGQPSHAEYHEQSL